MDYLDQTMPQFFRGENRPYLARGVATSSDPTTWAVRLTIIPASGATFSVSLASGVSRTVSGSGPWTCAFTFRLDEADTLACGAGRGQFQIDRTDTDYETVLAQGTVEIKTPLVALP